MRELGIKGLPARRLRHYVQDRLAGQVRRPGESIRISHETIYQALYVQSRGALKREFVTYLRTGRALRVPRARGKGLVSEEIMISERPAEAADRAVPGH